MYDGIANCTSDSVIVGLPDYFTALNRDYRYELTAINQPLPNLFIKKEIYNIGTEEKPEIVFKIGGCKKDAEVSWQVTGIRKDRFALANPIIPEVEKETAGYVHPELWEK